MASSLYRAYSFLDGGYLRKVADGAGVPWPNPRGIGTTIVFGDGLKTWGTVQAAGRSITLMRSIYYDARPDDDAAQNADLRAYWDAVELLDDTELGFGSLRRGGTKRRPPRQKGVDTLIAVDMLVGAFSGLFHLAILASGDADFVPVVDEVRRRGVAVVVAAEASSLSDDLRRAADRVVDLVPSKQGPGNFPALKVGDRTWLGESAV